MTNTASNPSPLSHQGYQTIVFDISFKVPDFSSIRWKNVAIDSYKSNGKSLYWGLINFIISYDIRLLHIVEHLLYFESPR